MDHSSPLYSQRFLQRIDPRRSLIAATMYLIIALAITFSIAAAIWVGGIARDNVLDQHVRRLSLETDQLSSDVGQALSARLGAVSTASKLVGRTQTNNGTNAGLRVAYEALGSAYPEFDWVAIANAQGTVVRSNGSVREGSRVNDTSWFSAGLVNPWVGVIDDMTGPGIASASSTPPDIESLGDMSAPVRDDMGHIVGVIAAHLSWRRTPDHTERLTDEADSSDLTEAYVLNHANVVLVGPADSRGKPWGGVKVSSIRSPALAADPVFERLPDGQRVLVARATLTTVKEVTPTGLQVLLSEPNERVYKRANAVTNKILWVSLCLGAVTALFGTLGARHLTQRLQRLALSVASVRRNDTVKIEVPGGRDEIAQLAEAFSDLIEDLEQERSELRSLSAELERRVAVRTCEVERLANESRYSAVVRERLKLARALHDTLAHSMMAIISEIRLIRKLQSHDPASVSDELARAEQLAHEGLSEARYAINQMRTTSVREAGLGPALSGEFERFINHTGLKGEFDSEPEAARFGDERSETLFRMAQEALRNVARHAMATKVMVHLEIIHATHLVLRIEDDGAGFDPEAPKDGHYGLIGLQEQAEMIGAVLTITSKPGSGTKVSISLRISPVVFAERV